MGHVCAMIVLVTAGSLEAAAQRLDGCIDHSGAGVDAASQVIAREARDRTLREDGYSLTRDSLVSALRDLREDVRAMAALKLGQEAGEKAELAPLMQAWLAENDACIESELRNALFALVQGLAWDPKQHPGGQWRVTPLQACTPSEHQLVSLTIEQTTDVRPPGPAVRILVRNLTPQTLAFVKAPYPSDLFSVTIMGPTGEPVKVKSGLEWMYEPVNPNRFPIPMNFARYLFLPLSPQEEVSWTWRPGNDFDMSVPGMYRVSFGGRIDYLDTTVCSNTLSMKIE